MHSGGMDAFLTHGIAGIAPTTNAWATPVVWPRITDQASLTSAQASVVTPSGPLSVAWLNSSAAVCAEVEENGVLELSCGTGATIQAITFASFGTPTGGCNTFQASSCSAANSTSVVSAACVGKAACSVLASDATFGDPCYGTYKRLYVAATCSAPQYSPLPLFQLNATTPVPATVVFPLGATAPSAAIVSESGNTVWSNGAFHPTAGITNAVVFPGVGLNFTVQSGSYAFLLTNH
jgi:hypothetical protein